MRPKHSFSGATHIVVRRKLCLIVSISAKNSYYI